MSIQNQPSAKGLQFSRRFTKEGVSPYDMFDYVTRSSTVYQSSGEVLENEVEVPAGWNQVSADKLVKNYFSQLGEPAGKANTVKEAAHHMAMSWKVWGERCGYFASEKDSEIFYDELAYSILNQACVPNHNHWLRTCIKEEAKVEVKAEAEMKSEVKAGKQCKQPHACFLLGLMNKVMDYQQAEA